MAKVAVPIQPVEDPILCSPYAAPHQHWLYDTATGLPQKIQSRREASYWYKTERTGSRQTQLLAEEERDDLPLVNALREDVKNWRESGWRNASQTTKRLLRHWWREDRSRRLFFCQIEAVETIIYLEEILAAGQRTRSRQQLTSEDYWALRRGENPRPDEWMAKVAQHPMLADVPDGGLLPLPRYACKMATGAGKTVVMAMLIAWAFCNRGATPADPRFPRRVLAMCPNLTIKERLQVLRPGDAGNYYQRFDVVPPSLRPELAKGKVLVANWHVFNPEQETVAVGGVTVTKLGEETAEAFARKRLGDLFDVDEPLMVLNDEGHHAYRPRENHGRFEAEEREDRLAATVWVEGLDKINETCGIGICVDLSATPFYLQGSGYPEGSPFPWIVSDFGLVDAIESGITKIPRLPAMDNSGRPDPVYFRLWDHMTANLQTGDRLPGGKPKPEAAYREAESALLTLAGEWKERFDQLQAATPGQERAPPVMILVCDNTDMAEHFHKMISGEAFVEETDADPNATPAKGRRRKRKLSRRFSNGLAGFPDLWNRQGFEATLRIDSKLLAAAESEDPVASSKEAAEKLRKVVSTIGVAGQPGERIRCVVSVNMLSEGWDASNVTQILGLRAFRSQLLCEQVVGRGLRRMDYTPDPETGLLTAEYVDVFGVPFSLIPFKGRVPGETTGKIDRPKHEVQALPERKHLEIRFPVVEGYVASLASGRIVCDVEHVERTALDPSDTPMATFIRPHVAHQVGHPSDYGGFELTEVDRSEYYRSVHPQSIEFAIAASVVGSLTNGDGGDGDGENGGVRHQSRQTLFPQVLRIVHDYIGSRVDFGGMHRCDVGLQTYAKRIVDLLAAAIAPADEEDATALLPRLNAYRPVGSTENVHFKTVKPVRATVASHVNYVACDTAGWEQAAMFQIERLAAQGKVWCYARNENLEFNIPYESFGAARVYEPDFIVELKAGLKVVVEVKGRTHAETSIKHEAAKRWVSAVNNWGELGRWEFLVCWDPQRLGDELTKVAAQHKARLRPLVERTLRDAQEETRRLRSLGWKQTDFANALCDFLGVPTDRS